MVFVAVDTFPDKRTKPNSFMATNKFSEERSFFFKLGKFLQNRQRYIPNYWRLSYIRFFNHRYCDWSKIILEHISRLKKNRNMQCTGKQYSENEKLHMRQTHRLIVSYKQQHHQAAFAFTATGLVFFYLSITDIAIEAKSFLNTFRAWRKTGTCNAPGNSTVKMKNYVWDKRTG